MASGRRCGGRAWVRRCSAACIGRCSRRSFDVQPHLKADHAHAPEKLDALLPDAEGEVPDPGIEAHNVHDRLLRSDAPS